MGRHPENNDALEYNGLRDERLVALTAQGDETAMVELLGRYKGFVRNKARSYFLVGADREDIIQEGMIGLYKAIRDYDPERSASFKLFAEICITRQMITAVKTATRQKHIPLNSYLSFNKPVHGEESAKTILDVLPTGRSANPEDLLIFQEEMTAIEKKMAAELSKLEWEVLSMHLAGRTYQEIAQELGRGVKSIDNALQRIKRKLEKKQ